MSRMIPLVVLALTGCESSLATWDGEGAFAVHAAFLTVCDDELGATHALAVASSGENCGDYVPVSDEPVAEPCDGWKAVVADACDPSATLTASATDVLSFWLDLDEDVSLIGASTDAASHFRCQEENRGVWSGDTTALSGTLSVQSVEDDVAKVDVALDGITGTIPFTVCR